MEDLSQLRVPIGVVMGWNKKEQEQPDIKVGRRLKSLVGNINTAFRKSLVNLLEFSGYTSNKNTDKGNVFYVTYFPLKMLLKKQTNIDERKDLHIANDLKTKTKHI